MADFTFNQSLGRISELYNRVKGNDPANSAFIVVALKATGISADAVLKDQPNLGLILTNGTTAEATNTGYARKVLTDTNLAAVAPDQTNDVITLVLPNQTWTNVAAVGGAWGKILICYDSDTAAGTDSSIVPCTAHDFPMTPNGTNVTVTFPATGWYRAT